MSDMSGLMEILRSLASHVPAVLVCGAGVIIAIFKWRQAPSASLLCLLGSGLLLFLGIVMPIVYALIPRMMGSHDYSVTRVVYSSLNVLWGLLAAGAYALLILAVYAGRGNAAGAGPNTTRPIAGAP